MNIVCNIVNMYNKGDSDDPGTRTIRVIEDIEIEPDTQTMWQKILNLIAKVICVPVVLIMRVHPKEIEVFSKSSNKENIYCQNERVRLNSGLYCETVIASRSMLKVPNALKDEKWRDNPGIALGMIAYLGFPVLWPGGEVFGTICVLDNKEREFTAQDIQTLGQFAQILQDDLKAVVDRGKLQSEIEEHLKDEQRLQRAQALAHVGNWEIDLKSRQMWASREAFRIYGIPYKDGYIPLELAQQIVDVDDRPMMDKALARLIQENTEYDMVFRIRRQEDGELRMLHSVAERESGPDGQPSCVIGVVQDITEFARAQQQIIDSEAKYKALFNETSAVHLIMDAEDGRIIDANIAASHYYGYPHSEFIGKHVMDINTMTPDKAYEILRMIATRQLNRFEAQHRMASGGTSRYRGIYRSDRNQWAQMRQQYHPRHHRPQARRKRIGRKRSALQDVRRKRAGRRVCADERLFLLRQLQDPGAVRSGFRAGIDR